MSIKEIKNTRIGPIFKLPFCKLPLELKKSFMVINLEHLRDKIDLRLAVEQAIVFSGINSELKNTILNQLKINTEEEFGYTTRMLNIKIECLKNSPKPLSNEIFFFKSQNKLSDNELKKIINILNELKINVENRQEIELLKLENPLFKKIDYLSSPELMIFTINLKGRQKLLAPRKFLRKYHDIEISYTTENVLFIYHNENKNYYEYYFKLFNGELSNINLEYFDEDEIFIKTKKPLDTELSLNHEINSLSRAYILARVHNLKFREAYELMKQEMKLPVLHVMPLIWSPEEEEKNLPNRFTLQDLKILMNEEFKKSFVKNYTYFTRSVELIASSLSINDLKDYALKSFTKCFNDNLKKSDDIEKIMNQTLLDTCVIIWKEIIIKLENKGLLNHAINFYSRPIVLLSLNYENLKQNIINFPESLINKFKELFNKNKLQKFNNKNKLIIYKMINLIAIDNFLNMSKRYLASDQLPMIQALSAGRLDNHLMNGLNVIKSINQSLSNLEEFAQQ